MQLIFQIEEKSTSAHRNRCVHSKMLLRAPRAVDLLIFNEFLFTQNAAICVRIIFLQLIISSI